ncbi:hypothetical protein [Synoicihabitans lomoniglobus]|uniref:Uncharacterized protein n=1 Tax=Synoicihabitans lomoniglobus TaxID=2909285 RepID=A0AAF0I304_9BACT|nr:hypothetical protein [Opitutaceae bacterium LMO-M01]WED66837.1 hypothetical protein PXH66_08240 [Opitutaceae bacterium LMO-M01]
MSSYEAEALKCPDVAQKAHKLAETLRALADATERGEFAATVNGLHLASRSARVLHGTALEWRRRDNIRHGRINAKPHLGGPITELPRINTVVLAGGAPRVGVAEGEKA